MTVIYFKRTGKIKDIFTGDLQHIDTIYGEESEDFKLICDEISLPDDNFVFQNWMQFKVNIETKQLEMLPLKGNYAIAST